MSTGDARESESSQVDHPGREHNRLVKLQDFVGNEVLVNLLRRVALPPASLFLGAHGVGKTTLALGLAAVANCKNGSSGDFCCDCGSCLKIASGNHPDVLLFEPGGTSISIEAMRHLNRESQFYPYQGKIRVFIVDQADKLTQEAANSILKTLEEPPATSHIVLTTSFPELLLPTIRSRCQKFRFSRLSRDEVKSYLEARFEAEEVSGRAAFSNGSIGKALSLDLPTIRDDRDLMLDLLAGWEEGESFEKLFQACQADPLRGELKRRDRVVHYLDLLRLLAEDLYFIRVETEQRIINHDRLQRLHPLANRLQLDWIREFLYHVGEARSDVEKYVNPLICFETLWLNAPVIRARGG